MADHQDAVAHVPTFWAELKHIWNDEVKFKGGLLHMIMMKDSDGVINIGAVCLVYVFPIVTVGILYLVMKSSFTTEDDIKERIATLEDRN